MTSSALPPQLFQRWYHSDEEDTDQERVYRPASYPFPRARAERAGMEFLADGVYVEYHPGPLDRAEARRGRWEAGGDSKIRVTVGTETRMLEVTSHSDAILTVRN